MENASKALLIAGAVLLAISIIGIGMFIFGRSRDVVLSSGDQIDNMSIKIHNQQFTIYEGIEMPYEKVKTLVARVQASNNAANATKYQITLSVGTYTNNTNTVFTSGSTYINANAFNAINDTDIANFKNGLFDVNLTYTGEGIINQIQIARRI